MSRITVSPAAIHGAITPPPSKSLAHRALICAALAGRGSVRGVTSSDDMQATLGAIRALGINIKQNNDTVTILPSNHINKDILSIIDCYESGSTLRFLIPVFAAKGIPCLFTGSGRLPMRPIGVYEECLPCHGVSLKTKGGLPLQMQGQLTAGCYELPGNISSQFISGLLFALPLCKGNSEIVLTTPLESAAYVDMTLDAMSQAGIIIEHTDNGWFIPGGQAYLSHEYVVEGDWSQAAFLLAMGAIGGEMLVTGMNSESRQGDRATLELIRRFGADVEQSQRGIICRKAVLRGINIDATQIPDLVPILAVIGALAQGITTITGAGRLRLKESDRLKAITHCINLLGGCIHETADGLRIEGVEQLHGGVIAPGYNDHRIVMSMAVAALGCEKSITIEDSNSVAKSWPTFFQDYNNCGGETNVI